MTVYLILAAAGVAFSLAVLAAIVWALTRSNDRIQMAGACLFGCIALYGAGAVQLHDADAMLGILAGAYALVLYGVLAAFAIFQKRWAWRATIVAFGLHAALVVALVLAALQSGRTMWLVLGVWVILGAVGLYASLHKGTRQAMMGFPA
jgi:O-antigen ligase